MNLEQKLTEALIQVFTRTFQNGVWLSLSDLTPLPFYNLDISREDFIGYINEADLSAVELKALIDLGTLYFSECKTALMNELNRRKSIDPNFSISLDQEVLPRLRKNNDRTWQHD
jgi:hypothetical protein